MHRNIIQNKMKLKDICKIQAGMHIKSSEYTEEGDAFFVSFRDFNEEGYFLETSPKVFSNEIKEKYFVEHEDVLFSTRMKFNAFQLPKSEYKYIASNTFVIIKPYTNSILPEYLWWFLNHPNTQRKLNFIAKGNTALPFISVKSLYELDVPVPNIQKQKQIIDYYKLHQKEIKLMQKIIAKKEKYTQTLLLQKTKI